MRRVMLLDNLLERRYFLRRKGCPRFNWKENALESWIIVVLEITFALQTRVNFSVNRPELCTHVGKLSVIHFEILKSEKLVCLFLFCKSMK